MARGNVSLLHPTAISPTSMGQYGMAGAETQKPDYETR